MSMTVQFLLNEALEVVCCARSTLCLDHPRAKIHSCPSSETGPEAYSVAYAAAKNRCLAALLAKINAEALRSAASKAHGKDILCRIPALDNDSDGLTDRLAFVANCIEAKILLSEVATLKFLADTKIPAPQVYAYALESPGNPVGVSYILMEKFMGSPWDWDSATQERREHVMEQLADVYLELEKYPFPLTGSLSLQTPNDSAEADKDQIDVGIFAQLAWFETSKRGSGPFTTLESAYKAAIQLQMQALANYELSSLPVDNYLTFLWRLNSVPDMIAKSVSREGSFYLKHFDDKGDHILFDEDRNITGIIDWEFASMESKELAFSSPCMMWPVSKFYDGDNSLTDEEVRFAGMFDARGRRDMGDIVRGGRQWQRFLFFLGSIPQDYTELTLLFEGLLKSCATGQQCNSSYIEWKASFLPDAMACNAEVRALLQYQQGRL